MEFFICEGQNRNIKKGYACVFNLLKSVARSLIRILSSSFYNQKNLTLFPVFTTY